MMQVHQLPRDDNGDVILPDPEHVRKGQRERCLYCGRIFNSRRPYFAHFRKDHLNDDGTWRTATHTEQVVADKEKPTKPWWVMHNDRSDPNYHRQA